MRLDLATIYLHYCSMDYRYSRNVDPLHRLRCCFAWNAKLLGLHRDGSSSKWKSTKGATPTETKTGKSLVPLMQAVVVSCMLTIAIVQIECFGDAYAACSCCFLLPWSPMCPADCQHNRSRGTQKVSERDG